MTAITFRGILRDENTDLFVRTILLSEQISVEENTPPGGILCSDDTRMA